jgi:hypothetical protein
MCAVLWFEYSGHFRLEDSHCQAFVSQNRVYGIAAREPLFFSSSILLVLAPSSLRAEKKAEQHGECQAGMWIKSA